ncbi:MAG: hypothetical protein IJU91_02385 [Selenomonadaceae bacterium]|nr:hypothetical protein [Selenomonadaceae bacterium]
MKNLKLDIKNIHASPKVVLAAEIGDVGRISPMFSDEVDAVNLQQFIKDILSTVADPSEINLDFDDGNAGTPAVIAVIDNNVFTYEDSDGDKWIIREAYEFTNWILENLRDEEN